MERPSDFDADSLRVGLPKAVASMDKALREGHVVYCHCTAGMGRSPGVAIAYLYWCLNFESLDQAYDFLTSKRPCGPKHTTRDVRHDVGPRRRVT